MSEWISVKDRLPEKGVRVLAAKGGDVFFGERWVDPNENEFWARIPSRKMGDSFAVVTHWMPLPEPPKGP